MEDPSDTDSYFVDPPLYGWKVKLDHVFTEKRNQNFRPRLSQLRELMGLFGRYMIWYIGMKKQKRKPFIDAIKVLPLNQIYGVPLGGIGSGTIGRGFKGEFCRFQLIPGHYQHYVIPADQFIVCIRKNGKTLLQQVLSTVKPKKGLESWSWDLKGSKAEYIALYPRAWTIYDLSDYNIKLVCRQISPVIPHDYKDSSLPCAVFVWTVHNLGEESLDVSIVFTFKNGTGSKQDRDGGCWTEGFNGGVDRTVTNGVAIYQELRGLNCAVVIAAKDTDNVEISRLVSFNPKSNGEKLWQKLQEDGQLFSDDAESDVSETIPVTKKGEEIAAAVCAKGTVKGKSAKNLEFCLAWHSPEIAFRNKEKTYKRWYEKWFSKNKQAVTSLASYALNNYPIWEKKINEWQDPILKNPELPDWYKSAIFNELYFVSDGGSVWIQMPDDNSDKEDTKVLPGDTRREFGRFGYLEGHEYRMFNTYDVHFYASFALIMLWPKLQLSIQYDMLDAIYKIDNRPTKFLMKGDRGPRKSQICVPHDVGDPEEEPWDLINAYIIHDTSKWKDLNLKFILQVFRDYVFTEDKQYLQNMWPAVKELMSTSQSWDLDNDGLIENSGFADQTYDSWIMKGPSAYCGGLWLASIAVSLQMASILKDSEKVEEYQTLLEKAKAAYNEKLWTGSYYKFDSSTTNHSNSIMSDQLCGLWYLNTCHIDKVFPKENVKKALETIYKHNVLGFKNGKMGAVNGKMPDGSLDRYTIQSEEIWIGVTYSLASTMIQEGMLKEGLTTAEGMYNTIYNDLGMGFQTPEAIFPEKHYRSIGYMRPLSIWSIQWALDNRHDVTNKNKL